MNVLLEVASDCADQALDVLEMDEPDVFIYFAHRAARTCDGSAAQERLVAAVTAHLERGGGVIVFHHGIYQEPPGKDAILELFGGSASGISWDTTEGQTIIATAPGHWVTTNGMAYEGTTPFDFAEVGVDASDYDYFTNVPDESYPNTTLLTEDGEERTILFATGSGASRRVLGYDLQRPRWLGRVVAYQPGEYQPNALDDLDGNNFQVLANAIYYVGTPDGESGPVGGGGTGSGGTGGGGTAGNASADSGTAGSPMAGGSGAGPQVGTAGETAEPNVGSPSSGGAVGEPAAGAAGNPGPEGPSPNTPRPSEGEPSSGGSSGEDTESPEGGGPAAPAAQGPRPAGGSPNVLDPDSSSPSSSAASEDDGCACRLLGATSQGRSTAWRSAHVLFLALGATLAVVRRRHTRRTRA